MLSKRVQTKNIMYNIPLIQILENAKLSTVAKRESMFCLGVVQGWDGGKCKKKITKGYRKTFGVMDMFIIWSVVMFYGYLCILKLNKSYI